MSEDHRQPQPAVGGPQVVVVGGGITGLAAAERLARSQRARVTLVEAGPRYGGLIATERTDGFVIEHGPDVILSAKPAAIELAQRVGIAHRLVGTSAAIRGALIVSGGRLLPLPEGMTGLVPSRLRGLMTSPLLPARAKVRAALEWFASSHPPDEHESVEAFVVRHFGRETYDRIVEPMLAGVFAGDGGRLSLDATFPRLRALETAHGSLLRAFVAEGRPVTSAASSTSLPRTPFLSFRDGLATLPEAAVAHLAALPGVELRRNKSVVDLTPRSPARSMTGGFSLRLSDGTRMIADAVVLAVPAAVAASLLTRIENRAACQLAAIELASTAVVTLGWPVTSIGRPLDASGYIVPRIEKGDVLACTWSSAKFEGRAPPGHALFRVFLGGVGREAVLDREDAELVTLARAELERSVGARGDPILTRVARWEKAMPQYTLGHLSRVAEIEERLSGMPRFALAGNALRGVGIPDCVHSGVVAAERVLQAFSSDRNSGGSGGSGGRTNPDKS